MKNENLKDSIKLSPNVDTISALRPEIRKISANNIHKLMKENHLSQKEFANDLGIAPTTFTNYCKQEGESALPPAEFYVALKIKYGINIDDFLTKQLNIDDYNKTDHENNYSSERNEEYDKYVGLYHVYYLDTGSYKCRDDNSRNESLTYGLLLIFENKSNFSESSFECIAIMGISTQSEMLALKKEFQPLEKPEEIVRNLSGKQSSKLYTGDFEIQDQFAYISLVHGSSDRALAIFNNPTTNKEKYIGGIGTVNSVSKGREKMPTIQYLAITRDPINKSAEEIHQALLLSYPEIKTDEFTPKLVDLIKKLYDPNDSGMAKSSELQKEIIVRANTEMYIKENLERNLFRYAKVSNTDDDAFYHWISSKDDNSDFPSELL